MRARDQVVGFFKEQMPLQGWTLQREGPALDGGTELAFEVVTATDGVEALKAVFETHPDIIVLDYNMPRKNGLEVAQDLKNNPLFAHIPIMIVTAHGEKQAKLKGLSMGIDDYLIKPVDADELVARIRAFGREGQPFLV